MVLKINIKKTELRICISVLHVGVQTTAVGSHRFSQLIAYKQDLISV